MDPRAGQPAKPEDLVDVSRLVTDYYTLHPDPDEVSQQVAFGTSGHRGSAADTAFNDDHIAATTQAICEYRAGQGYTGPVFMGRDTHALSEPAHATALEVLAANDVTVLVDSRDRYVPTPAVSHAILRFNAAGGPKADGIVITPSHNPTAASSTTRRTAVRPTPMSPDGSRTVPTRSCATVWPASSGCP